MEGEESNSAEQFTTELSRELTLFHITMMGVGMMIGAGVFVGMGNCLYRVGPGGTLVTFALNAFIAMCSAMSYAELSSAIPKAGGAYNFARIGFGRGTSFFAGWMEWCASSVAGSLYAVTFAMYTLNFLSREYGIGLLPWQHSQNHISIRILAVVTASLFAYINYRGASETGKIGSFITIGQTLTLAFVAFLGIVVAVRNPERFQNFQPFLPEGWLSILATMGFIYVAFEGFEVIAQAGDETIDAERNLPKAMMLSVVIVAVTYVLVSTASVLAVEDLGGSWQAWIGQDKDVLFSRIVSELLPVGGGLLVVLAVLFSATSALNATTYSATRAVFALGRDQLLPGTIAKISPRKRTPTVAIFVTWIIIVGIVSFLPVVDVASSASIMFLMLFFLVNVCALRMRRRMGDELKYGYVMPLFPLPPLLAIAAQIVLAWELHEMSIVAWIVAPVWLAAGFLVYHFYGKSHVKATRHEIVTLSEVRPESEKDYRILLPVANPDNALKMVTQTLRIAETNDAHVELIHMVPVPDQIPLSDAERYANPGHEAIAEAMLYLSTRFPISKIVRYCRNPARGILSAAREHRTDLIIMGWKGRTRRSDFLFGSTVDPILERNACDVIVLKDCVERVYHDILVPFAGGPHSLLALRTASMLVEPEDGRIVPFNVTVPGRPTVDIEQFLEKNRASFHCPVDRFYPNHAVARNISETILEEAEGYGLTIVGATEEKAIRRLTTQSLPELLAAQLSTPLIMVKAGTPVKSWVNRWF